MFTRLAHLSLSLPAAFYSVRNLFPFILPFPPLHQKLVEIKGLSEAKMEKLYEACKKMCPTFGLMSAKDFETQRQREIIKISTGCSALDELLQGGIESKAITEIFGEWRTGKTQLCHTLCVTTQMGEGAAAGRVAYVDTEGTFRPDRVRPIAARFNLDADAVLANVLYVRAYTFDQQYDVLEPLAAKMVEEPFRLLIMDSITANMRVDYSGRTCRRERRMRMRGNEGKGSGEKGGKGNMKRVQKKKKRNKLES